LGNDQGFIGRGLKILDIVMCAKDLRKEFVSKVEMVKLKHVNKKCQCFNLKKIVKLVLGEDILLQWVLEMKRLALTCRFFGRKIPRSLLENGYLGLGNPSLDTCQSLTFRSKGCWNLYSNMEMMYRRFKICDSFRYLHLYIWTNGHLVLTQDQIFLPLNQYG